MGRVDLENTNKGQVEFFLKDKPFADAFKCLFENAGDAIYLLDNHGNFVSANRKAEELTGFRREDFVGKPFRKIIPMRRLPKAIRGFLDVIRGKETKLELELKTSKKTILAEVTSNPLIVEGKIVGTLGIVRDITERKKMEQALRESEEKFRKIFENASDSLIYLDLSGRIADVNQKTLEVFGGSKEELLGKHFTRVGVFSFTEVPKLLSNFSKILSGKESFTNLWIKNKKGQKRYLKCSSAIMKVEGKIASILVIARDSTERKEMEKRLEEYSQHLEELVERRTRQLKEAQEKLIKSERLAAIGQVASMVGHDLRNPLTGIIGATYYLKRKLESDEDQTTREMLELIEKSVQYSDIIIKDLLEYSREIKLEFTETTAKSLLKEALMLVEVPANVKVVDETQDKQKLEVDVEKTKRVFVNIVKNAIDAMPHGGKLMITSKESNGNVEFTLADTGTGMTQEVMEKIRTPFFTTKAKGMGLGLAICKRIVEAHGGELFVQSKVGKGTTFTVTLPLSPKVKKEKGGEKIWVNPPEFLLSTTTKA